MISFECGNFIGYREAEKQKQMCSVHSQRSLLHEDFVRCPLVEIEGTDPSGQLWRLVAPDHVAGDQAAVEPSEPVRQGCHQSAICRSPP